MVTCPLSICAAHECDQMIAPLLCLPPSLPPCQRGGEQGGGRGLRDGKRSGAPHVVAALLEQSPTLLQHDVHCSQDSGSGQKSQAGEDMLLQLACTNVFVFVVVVDLLHPSFLGCKQQQQMIAWVCVGVVQWYMMPILIMTYWPV